MVTKSKRFYWFIVSQNLWSMNHRKLGLKWFGEYCFVAFLRQIDIWFFEPFATNFWVIFEHSLANFRHIKPIFGNKGGKILLFFVHDQFWLTFLVAIKAGKFKFTYHYRFVYLSYMSNNGRQSGKSCQYFCWFSAPNKDKEG